MNKKKWSSRVLIRYWLLQLPALALLVLILIFAQRWVDLPAWIFWGALVIWVVKDAVLYPFVWRAYDWDRSEGSNSMVGAKGIAKEPLAPSGYVRARGELWKAELAQRRKRHDRHPGDFRAIQKILRKQEAYLG